MNEEKTLYTDAYETVKSLMLRVFDHRYTYLYKKLRNHPIYKLFAIRTYEYQIENKDCDDLTLIKNAMYITAKTKDADIMLITGYKPVQEDSFLNISEINYMDRKHIVVFMDCFSDSNDKFAYMIYKILMYILSDHNSNLSIDPLGVRDYMYIVKNCRSCPTMYDTAVNVLFIDSIMMLTLKCIHELDIEIDFEKTLSLIIPATDNKVLDKMIQIYKIVSDYPFTVDDLIYNGFLPVLLEEKNKEEPTNNIQVEIKEEEVQMPSNEGEGL